MSNRERGTRLARLVRFVWLGKALAALGVLVGVATAHVVLRGETEIQASTAALERGDVNDATVHARRAASFYIPGAPHVRVAYDRLVGLATAAEGIGQREASLAAWHAIRSAALESRWLMEPQADLLARANREIARLSRDIPRPPIAREMNGDAFERRYLEALTLDQRPRRPWIVLLLGAFLTWVLGALWFVRRAVTKSGTLVPSRAMAPLAMTGVGIALWVIAIWRA